MTTLVVANIKSTTAYPPTIQNSSGATNGWIARAFVRFNASSGTPTIVSSGNVSSIGDNAVGNFTINFTNAMSDANYIVVGSQANPTYIEYEVMFDTPNGVWTPPTTTGYKVSYHGQSAYRDPYAVMHVVYSN